MRAIIQRVKEASVRVEGKVVSSIEAGVLILLGIEAEDTSEDINWLTSKIAKLRIFEDKTGIMNCSLSEVNGSVIVVSQFTLHASTKKGNRPSYIKAARPEFAQPMYDEFVIALNNMLEVQVQTGIFGAMMEVALINDGPVTIMIDTKNKE